MTMTMHADIVSLDTQIFTGRVQALFITGKLGELGIYPGHSPLLSSIKPGYTRIINEKGEDEIYCIKHGGLIEVQPTVVTVLADQVVRAADLDEAAALEVKERAEKALAGKQSELEYAEAAASLAAAIAELQAIQQLRKKYKV